MQRVGPWVSLLLLVAWVSAAPPMRKIVPDLTLELLQQLRGRHVDVLFVLPGTAQPNQVKSINWDNVTRALPHVEYIKDFSDFSMWHKAHARAGHIQSARGLRGWLAHSLPQPRPENPLQRALRQHPPRTRVAILTLANEGIVHTGVANLAMAITRRLRSAVVLSMAHNTHQSKPSTLVTFNDEGKAISAAVLETTIFRDAFSQVYDSQAWGPEGGGSGPGSSIAFTSTVRKHLTDVLTRYNIRSMLDSSCGSFLWLPYVLMEHEKTHPEFKFMGTDVVCKLIDRHKEAYKNHTNWGFKCVDYAAQPLPSGYELVFSRDSLQHVPFHAVWQFLNNVRASGAKYLLVGSYVKDAGPNHDIAAGGYYSIDLLKPPFQVSKPLQVFEEPEGKHLLLFELANMTWSDPLDGLQRR